MKCIGGIQSLISLNFLSSQELCYLYLSWMELERTSWPSHSTGILLRSQLELCNVHLTLHWCWAELLPWVSVLLPYLKAESWLTHRLVPVMADTLRIDLVLPAFISSAPRSQTSIWDWEPWLTSFWMGCCDLDNTAMVRSESYSWIVPKKKLFNTI